MSTWLRRVRGAVGMGVTWAVTWAATGIAIGVASVLTPWLPWDGFFAVFDAPLPALAMPGFIGGMLFAGVLGVAERRRHFAELSLGRVAAWGAVGGVLLSLIPAAMVLAGLATLGESARGLWHLTGLIVVPFALLNSACAASSLVIARRGEERARLAGGDATEVPELTDVEVRELLGGQR